MLKKIIIMTALVIAIISCSKKELDKKKPLKGVLSFVQGEVSKSKDAVKWEAAKLKDAIFENDWIKTSYKSFAKIKMWQSTSFTIYPKSKVQIKELVKGKFDMTVNEGKVHCTVQKIAQGGHYRVKGPALLAGVRGTEFTFISDGKKDILLVRKGSVAVRRNIKNAPIILLKPGESIEVSIDENKKLKKQAEGKTEEEQKKILNIKEKKRTNTDQKHDDETEKMIKKHENEVNKKSSEHDKFVKKKSKEIDDLTKKKSEELQKSIKGSDDIGKDAQNSLKRRKASKNKKKNSKADELRKKIKF